MMSSAVRLVLQCSHCHEDTATELNVRGLKPDWAGVVCRSGGQVGLASAWAPLPEHIPILVSAGPEISFRMLRLLRMVRMYDMLIGRRNMVRIGIGNGRR